MITLRNINKSFRVAKRTSGLLQATKALFHRQYSVYQALDDISFTIKAGCTLGVVGESGCGKSTLGRTILGLIENTEGRIFYKNEDITHTRGKARKELRKGMQIIFQDPFSSLNPRMTVERLIADPLKAYRAHQNKAELKEHVHDLMEVVGLAPRLANSYPHELDGGRRQRIGVARALALEPDFIVCDEPVSALDVSIQAQILNLLQDLQEERGIAYVFITHDLSVVKHISNDIMVMYLGVMVEKSASGELFEYPLHPYTKGLLSAIPVPDIHIEKEPIIMKGELTSPVEPKPGCRFAARCPYTRDKCIRAFPVSEEVMPGHFAACHYIREINELA